MPKNPSNELHFVRVYDAPLDLVWDAWTDVEQVKQWWGPRGFTLTSHSKELRPGGIWHYTMHGPDGTDYPNKTLYHEVEEKAKLVYDHGGYDDRPPLFRVTVLFHESEGKTVMEMTMAFPTPEEAEATRKFIKEVGGHSTWDRLAEYLDEKTTDRSTFVINRDFEAPKELVFEMWTNPEHVSKWLPPVGFDMEILRGEIKVGESTFYKMTNHADVTMYGRIEYREINRPCRLVYSQQFCDENENLSRHPGLSVFPATMLTTVIFASEDSDVTRVTVNWEPIGNPTPGEIQAFIDLRPGMTEGWTGSFDKLESLMDSE